MDSSFWFDTVYLGWSIVYIEGHILSFTHIVFVLTDSVDPDEMSWYSTFRLGLHCLSKFALRSYQYTKS